MVVVVFSFGYLFTQSGWIVETIPWDWTVQKRVVFILPTTLAKVVDEGTGDNYGQMQSYLRDGTNGQHFYWHCCVSLAKECSTGQDW